MSEAPSLGPEATLGSLVSQTLGPREARQISAIIPALAQDLTEIDRRLQQVLRARYAQLSEAAIYACGPGGKRIRPLLMATCHRALGAKTSDRIHSMAAAFELIHTASLVHDDVIDHSPLRRGRRSLPAAFGLPTAIVTGDFLFVRAFELAAEYSPAIILRCGEACADLVEGEVLEDANRFDLTIGREHYFRVIERKTAAIIAAGLASVAEVDEQPAAVVDGLAAFGRALGMAFQIQDDLLDVYGDPDLLGKPLFTDLREGTPTLLSVEAYSELDGARKREFERKFAQRRKRSSDLLRLKALTDQTDAPRRVAEEARRWAERAIYSIALLPPSPFHLLLDQAAQSAATRQV